MTNEERIVELTKKLSGYDWFDSVGMDQFGKMVVYVHTGSLEVMNTIPDEFDSKRVVWQYATTKPGAVKLKYNTAHKPEYHVLNFQTTKLADTVKVLNAYTEMLKDPEPEKDLDINFLISELDRLEKICGSKTLQDIFYEVHDGKNAVTNLKDKFPAIYDDVLDLYEEFGFDIIYNELDG